MEQVFAVVELGMRSSVGAAFIVAGLGKLREPLVDRLSAVARFSIVPLRLRALVAGGLPWVEFVLGFALVLGLSSRLVGALSVVVTSSFAAAIIISIHTGHAREPCGCFGSFGGGEISYTTAARNLAMAGALLPSVILGGRGPFVLWTVEGRLGSFAYANIVLAGFATSLAILAWRSLALTGRNRGRPDALASALTAAMAPGTTEQLETEG